MNVTTRFRVVFVVLFVVSSIAGVVGWIIGLDPSPLVGVLAIEAAALGVGEASNVGKRWTNKTITPRTGEPDRFRDDERGFR